MPPRRKSTADIFAAEPTDWPAIIKQVTKSKPLQKRTKKLPYPGTLDGPTEFDMTITESVVPAIPTPPEPKPGTTYMKLQKVVTMSADGVSKAAIAKELEKSEEWVEGSLAIMTRLPQSAHEAIRRKKITRTTALQMLFAPPDKLEEIIDGAVKLATEEGVL